MLKSQSVAAYMVKQLRLAEDPKFRRPDLRTPTGYRLRRLVQAGPAPATVAFNYVGPTAVMTIPSLELSRGDCELLLA